MTKSFVIWQNRHLYIDGIHCLQLYLALRCLDGHSSGSFLRLHWLFCKFTRCVISIFCHLDSSLVFSLYVIIKGDVREVSRRILICWCNSCSLSVSQENEIKEQKIQTRNFARHFDRSLIRCLIIFQTSLHHYQNQIRRKYFLFNLYSVTFHSIVCIL